MTMPQKFYMWEALTLAGRPQRRGGTGGVRHRQDGPLSAGARNRQRKSRRSAPTAEMEAMAQANAAVSSWRLEGCARANVTLEPCPHVRRGHSQRPDSPGLLRCAGQRLRRLRQV